ncbi:MAG: hypothetical protein IJX46_09510, partial [Clostridia bacterium]|nr:hypothetical protein [Clostridia bacterium]
KSLSGAGAETPVELRRARNPPFCVSEKRSEKLGMERSAIPNFWLLFSAKKANRMGKAKPLWFLMSYRSNIRLNRSLARPEKQAKF